MNTQKKWKTVKERSKHDNCKSNCSGEMCQKINILKDSQKTKQMIEKGGDWQRIFRNQPDYKLLLRFEKLTAETIKIVFDEEKTRKKIENYFGIGVSVGVENGCIRSGILQI